MKYKTLFLSSAFLLSLCVSVEGREFNCGWSMCGRLGISKEQCRKLGLPLALNWPNRFQRVTYPAPGVVVVQSRRGRALGGGRGGHVSQIVSVDANGNTAIVRDNRGTYRRNIKRNLVALVSVGDKRWTD